MAAGTITMLHQLTGSHGRALDWLLSGFILELFAGLRFTSCVQPKVKDLFLNLTKPSFLKVLFKGLNLLTG